MNNLNSVIVEGNLVKDADFDETIRGTSFCAFSVATNRYYKAGEDIMHEVSYFDVEAWGNLAKSCKNLLVKGSGVRIVGRLKQDRWNNEDGKAMSRVKIVAEHIEAKPLTAAEQAALDKEKKEEAEREANQERYTKKKAKVNS